MVMNGLTTIESKRRAVAPIIATLLMVAIAVVGGILIFVFTQGFFADEQVVGPTVDNFRIFGYNASDSTKAGAINGDALTCASAQQDTILDEDDCITVFIENIGDKAIAVQSVRVFGQTYTVDATATTTATCSTLDGKYVMMDDTDNGPLVISVLDPNHKGVICLTYDQDQTEEVDPGKSIPIQVQTVNGQVGQINIINGASRGGESD